MKNSADRILTTHVGSLVRAPHIVEAMIRDQAGEPLPKTELAATLRGAVSDVVRKQAEIGIDIIDDGEFGKSSWIAYVAERFDGLERVTFTPEMLGTTNRAIYPEPQRYGDFYRRYNQHEYTQWLPDTASRARYVPGGMTEYGKVFCAGPLSYRPGPLQRDIDNFKAALDGVAVVEAFLPVVAPASLENIGNQHYKTAEDYLFALADVLAVEYEMVAKAGFILQVDDAILPMQRFMKFRDKSLSEFRTWAQVRIDALNHALRNVPEDRVRYHICFGSQNIPHTSDPGLGDVLDIILRAKAQAYSIEACNPRHEHEWQIWESTRLPEGKILIPGVLSHATNIVEHPELVALRLKNFARLVGRESVIAGTDCGFSQSWNSPRVHEQVQWAKLEAMVEGARIASKALWH
jgi:5-methyltetrahydropteroyltriglutamate--homocysteine methyltransferase